MTILDEILQTKNIERAYPSDCGCSGGKGNVRTSKCQCGKCSAKEMQEEEFLGALFRKWFSPSKKSDRPAKPVPPKSKTQNSTSGTAVRSCSIRRPGKATAKCKRPGKIKCPALPNLLCMRGVNGIPFEYLHERRYDRSNRLDRVLRSQKNRQQRFVPATRNALIEFTKNMKRFGMPIKSIITLGSLYCRCIKRRGSDRLSNHSYGEAIDLVGVRWAGTPSFSRVEDTFLTSRNLRDKEQRRLLQRMNACARLSFNLVIDYNYNSAHTNHFHCDMNKATVNSRRGYNLKGKTTLLFVQESLNLLSPNKIRLTGKLDSKTYRALSGFSGESTKALRNSGTLKRVYMELFEKIASGNF